MSTSEKSLDASVLSTKSLDLSTNIKSHQIRDLRDEIEDLKSQLEVTQNELENTIIQNNEYIRQINKLKLEIDTLKELCKSSKGSSKKQHLSNRKEKLRKLDLTEYLNSSGPISNSSLTSNIKASNQEIGDNLDQDTTTSERRKNIIIMGGRQCKGLSYTLAKSRINTPYEKYHITSMVKPDAPTGEILKSCDIFKITSEDILILSVGEHDENPMKVMTELSAALKTLSQCSVFLLSVNNNKYLNEFKLNEMLYLISKNFLNCHFIDLNENLQCRDKSVCKINTTLLDWTLKINHIIDSIDYQNRYLSYNKRRYTASNAKPKIIKKARSFKQTTILEYFSKTTKYKRRQTQLNGTNNNKSFFRS